MTYTHTFVIQIFNCSIFFRYHWIDERLFYAIWFTKFNGKKFAGIAVWHRESNLFSVVFHMDFALMPHRMGTITEIPIGLIVHFILFFFRFVFFCSVYWDCWFDLSHSKNVLVQKLDRCRKINRFGWVLPFFLLLLKRDYWSLDLAWPVNVVPRKWKIVNSSGQFTRRKPCNFKNSVHYNE